MSDIDLALTAQIVVAWAGESGEDLLRRLLPSTWPWAVLQGARETARRRDAELRQQDHDPDRIVSLFNFGFSINERIEERLQDLKRSGRSPQRGVTIISVRARNPGVEAGEESAPPGCCYASQK